MSCNPNTWKAEAGGSGIGQSWLHRQMIKQNEKTGPGWPKGCHKCQSSCSHVRRLKRTPSHGYNYHFDHLFPCPEPS